MFLAGTDNDYSVTQSGQGTQFDVYFNFALPDPYLNSIQCPLDQTTNCFFNNGGAAATLDSNYQLLPGVLHSYYAAAGDSSLTGYVVPVPEPGTLALFGAALALLVLRRRA